MLMVLAVAVFARGLRGLAVDVAALSSWWVLNPVAYGLALVLLVLRRFRHLILWLVVANLLALIGGGILSPVTQRPRPFGVAMRLRRWAGGDPVHAGAGGSLA
jgi:hypothetical protein